MRVNLKLSRVGMNMQEATLIKWHKQRGDAFKAGDPLYEIETEKVTQEVQAPGDGTLLEILVPEGEIAQVDAPVCTVDINPARAAS
jgi:pyruvate/2-oxoglutarate dehydrogenase complex dihydrolipoamide acyltransferase (E2) component